MISGTTEAIVVSAERMTEVMSRIPIDLSQALRPERVPAVIAAAIRCRKCARVRICDKWIASHDEGGAHAVPDFCPNARLLDSCRPAISR
jgi:hypothetical protein